MTKVLFIEMPKDGNIAESRSKDYEYITPLWALTLATYLKERINDLEVKIIDGRIGKFIDMKEIIKEIRRFKPDFVGISPKFTNYSNALEAARIGKKVGAKIILGGAHALHLKKEILTHRGLNSDDPCIDVIVQFDGERALYEYISGKPLSEINNLVYREKNKIKENPIVNLSLDSLPVCNRDFLNLEKDYFKKRRTLIIYSQKGCSWREKTGGCIFCALMDISLRLRNPEKVWQEINFLNNKYRLDSIWDSAENLFSDLDWLYRYHRASFKYPRKPGMKIFMRMDRVNEETAKMLKDINVIEAIVGIESGSPLTLKSMRKGETVEQNKRAIKFLHEHRVKTFHCFILGAPGESKETILETMAFVKELNKDKKNITGTRVNVLMPFPGSCAWQMLVERTGRKYKGKDIIDWREVSKDWIRVFCKISPKDFGEMINWARKNKDV